MNDPPLSSTARTVLFEGGPYHKRMFVLPDPPRLYMLHGLMRNGPNSPAYAALHTYELDPDTMTYHYQGISYPDGPPSSSDLG